MSKALDASLNTARRDIRAARAPVQKAAVPADEGGSRAYAQLAVGTQHGNAAPAEWVLNRHEFVRNYRNSVYIAASAIARRMAMQEPRVGRRVFKKSGVKVEPVKGDHPLLELFRECNPQHNSYELNFYTEAYKLIVGESITWKTRNGFGTPIQLWVLPPQWCRAVPDENKFISGYRVDSFFGGAGEVFIPADDVIVIREPNLDQSGSGRFYGQPPLAASAYNTDVENAMLKRLYHSFRNYAPPGQIFSTDTRLNDGQLLEVYNAIVSQHSLAEQTGRPMITHSGLKPMMQASTTREMDYARSLDVTLTQTMAAFGVPKAVVGLVQDANRSNMQAALQAFVDNTLNPRLVQNGQAYSYGLAREFEPDGSLVVWFPKASANDAEDMRKAIDIAAKSQAITPDEIRELMFPERQPFETGGDHVWANSSTVPLKIGDFDPDDDPLTETVIPPGLAANAGIEPEEDEDEQGDDDPPPNNDTDEDDEAEAVENAMRSFRDRARKRAINRIRGNGVHL